MLPIISFRVLVELVLMISSGPGTLIGVFFDTLESSVLADNLDVWTDGSLVADDLIGSAGGAGIYAHASGSCWVSSALETP